MSISPNINDLERDKFVESTSVPGQPGVVVLNPDGSSISSGMSANQNSIGLFNGIAISGRSQDPDVESSHTSNGTDTGSNSRLAFPITQPTGYMSLVFANKQSLNGTYSNPTISIIITASIEFPSGTFRQVFFRGQTSITLAPGATITSDPVAVPGVLAAGTVVFVRTFVSTAGGSTASGAWPLNVYTASAEGEGSVNTTSGAPNDLTLTGTITASTGFAFGPYLITGPSGSSSMTTVAGYGDSIMAGKNATGPDGNYYIWGPMAWALNLEYGYINLGKGGDTLVSVVGNPVVADTRMAFASAFKNVVSNYGSNDIMIGSITTAQTQINMLAAWTIWNGLGARVFQTTCPPRTSSTDSWATTANQTPVTTNANAGETGRQTINAWLRAGAPIVNGAAVAPGTAGAIIAGQSSHPLYAVWDWASTVESTTAGVTGAGGSVWALLAQTNDGIHPLNGGEAAFVTVTNLSQLI